jgi:predicted secreted hydrolase
MILSSHILPLLMLVPHLFHCDSRTSRGAYGDAGFGEDSKLAWIEDWAILFDGNFRLRATSKDYAISLGLIPEKQAVLQGNDGLVQASEGEGRASYYYSISRLKTSGTVRIGDQSYEVEGGSWFDSNGRLPSWRITKSAGTGLPFNFRTVLT